MGALQGKVAAVLGGSGGFGAGIAKRFIAEGAQVWLGARSEARLQKTAAELGAQHFACDITQSAQLQNFAAHILQHSGRLDVAVNSAGYEDNSPVAQLDPQRTEQMVAVQFTGALYFIQHMANAMCRNATPGGSVITIGSLTATLTAEGYAAYAGAKAGVNHATRIAASEYGAQGVRCNVISATLVETPMTAQIINAPGVRDAFVGETPLGRFGTVADIVNAVLWLASDEAAFVTGQNLHIDGGTSLRRLPRADDFVRAAAAAAASK